MLYDVEEDFDLGVAPKRARFSARSGGASRHLMVNGTAERMAIKVKCSNNSLFRIAPVYTTLDPGCAQRLQVVRDPGAPGMDKLILLYTRTTGRNPREVFAACDKTQLRRLLIALDAREGDDDAANADADVEKCRRQRRDADEGGSAGRGGEGSSGAAASSIPMIDD